CVLELFGEFLQRNASLTGSANGLVLHIRDVRHAMQRVASQFQVTLKQIFEDIGAEISNVRTAINRRSARVHSDWTGRRIARLEFLNFARVGIKKAKSHLAW